MAWAGVGVPRGTPGEIIERLNHEINAVLADPVVRKRLDDVGATPIFYTTAEFSALMAAETEKWAEVVKFSRVNAERGREAGDKFRLHEPNGRDCAPASPWIDVENGPPRVQAVVALATATHSCANDRTKPEAGSLPVYLVRSSYVS
jgi:Tripartite tricarboxylate transporter family receptor